MSTGSILGLPWWVCAGVLVVACVAVFVLVRGVVARAAHREAAEKLAQNADAVHEGAQTRHGGGP